MFINTCAKCGQEFETKNPKRVVCPTCLYPDRVGFPQEPVRPTAGGFGRPPAYPQQQQAHGMQQGYPSQPYPPQPYPQQPGGYPPRYGNQGNRPPFQGGQRPYGPPGQQQGGRPPFRGPGGGPGRPGFGGGRPGFGRGGPGGKKKLLEPGQLIEIEKRYKAALPLPNHDIHETIGTALNLEPSKVFFGINLVRQKMKLPKLPFPKRKLAVTPDQMMAVQALYEPYLPEPPIGIHKIIAKQLKMDEWRVHVAIGLIRKSMALPRWNEERPDIPAHMKEAIEAAKVRMHEQVQQQAQQEAQAVGSSAVITAEAITSSSEAEPTASESESNESNTPAATQTATAARKPAKKASTKKAADSPKDA